MPRPPRRIQLAPQCKRVSVSDPDYSSAVFRRDRLSLAAAGLPQRGQSLHEIRAAWSRAKSGIASRPVSRCASSWPALSGANSAGPRTAVTGLCRIVPCLPPRPFRPHRFPRHRCLVNKGRNLLRSMRRCRGALPRADLLTGLPLWARVEVRISFLTCIRRSPAIDKGGKP